MATTLELGTVSRAILAVRNGEDPLRNMQIICEFARLKMANALGRSQGCGIEGADEHIANALLWAWIKLSGVNPDPKLIKIPPGPGQLADVNKRDEFLDILIRKAFDFRRDARKKQQRAGRDKVMVVADLGDRSAAVDLLAQASITQLEPDEIAEMNEILTRLRLTLNDLLQDEMDRKVANDFLLQETAPSRDTFCHANQMSDIELTTRIKRIIIRLRKLPIRPIES